MRTHEEKLAYTRAWQKRKRAERLAAGICLSCGKQKIYKKSKRHCLPCLQKQRNNFQTKFKEAYREKRTEYMRKWYRRLKEEVFAAYGGAKCNCPGCKETMFEFMEIDHIASNGKAHREKLKKSQKYGWLSMYYWLRKNNYPTGFQILCTNCNQGKNRYGSCPHLKEQNA